MKVTDIQFADSSLDTQSPFFEKLVNAKVELPTMHKHIIKFKLVDSNEALANAIRRVFNDELRVPVMYAHSADLDTNDKFILPDNVLERLMLIPVSSEDKKRSLKVENNTDEIIKVYSSDIKPNMGFNKNIQLCSLRPGKHLYINNIQLKEDFGYVDNAHTMGTYRYSIPVTGESMSVDHSEIEMELSDNGQSGYLEMITKVRDNLKIRLSKVASLVSSYEIPVNIDAQVLANETNTNEIYILENKDVYEIHIKNEYHTIGNLLCKYVLQEKPDIELINYKLEHILKHKIIVNIVAKDYKKIITAAIKKCIADVDYWFDEIKSKLA